MKVWIEIQFDNCLDCKGKIELRAVNPKGLKLQVTKFTHAIEELQATIDSMVLNSEAEQ